MNGHALNIGVESVSGYQQVYYLYNDVKVFITNNQRNHTQPAISGRYVTWTETVEGFPQIVLYDLLDKTILQITQTGTNLSPSIWGNKIVWEGVNRGLQQVFYFDGTEIYQISHDSTSLRPKIQDNKIVYAQYTGKSGKEWQVVLYDLAEPAPGNRYKVIKEGGESDSWPSFVDGQIKTTID